MATYKIKGIRYLRKYTAESQTPVYAAAVDAQRIATSMGELAWEKSSEADAQMSYHTEEKGEDGVSGLDKNVEIRERLDAALFCAGHVGGTHRAYANAASYVFRLPELAAGQSYPRLESLSVQVVSDPFNSVGARIALHTNSTGEIPAVCSEARTGAVHAEGVAKRTERTVDGARYWYPTSERCELRPEGGLQLERYVMVVVALEDYSVVRGDWLEGSSYIEPVVEIVTDGEITGWNDGATEDAKEPERSIVVREVGTFGFIHGSSPSVPSQPFLGSDYCIAAQSGGERWVAIRDSTGEITGWELGASSNPEDWEQSESAENGSGRMGISTCYSLFREDKMTRCSLKTNISNTSMSTAIGAGWSYGPGVNFYSGISDGTKAFFGPAVIARKKLLSTFTLPLDFKAHRIKLDWDVKEGDGRWQRIMKMKHNLWIYPGAYAMDYERPSLQRHELYTAELDKVSEWQRLVSVEEHVFAAEAKSVTHISDLPMEIGAGPHTLLFTVYADLDACPEDYDEAEGVKFPIGTGWGNSTVRSAENFLVFDGAFDGGWDPTVTLIG